MKVQWKSGDVMRVAVPEGCMAPIEARLDDEAPRGAHADALGYATPFAHGGTRIHVLLDRVVLHDASDGDVALLAHVLAHEIGHVLEGSDHHSPDGVMKACFGPHDLIMMRTRPLKFDDLDATIIREALARHATAVEATR